MKKATNRKSGPIKEYSEFNSIVEFYIKTRLFDADDDDDQHGSFNVNGLLEYKKTLNEEEATLGIVSREEIQSFIEQYITREREKMVNLEKSIKKLERKTKKAEKEKKPKKKKEYKEDIEKLKNRLSLCPCWIDFYRYLQQNWRLFVFLDLLCVYSLLDGRVTEASIFDESQKIRFTQPDGNRIVAIYGTFPDHNKPKAELQKRALEIYDAGVTVIKKKETIFKEPRFRVYSVLFDATTGDKVFKTLTTGQFGFFAALVAINRSIKNIRANGLLRGEQQQQQQQQEEEEEGEAEEGEEANDIDIDDNEPVIVTKLKWANRRKFMLTETGEIVGQVPTIGSTKKQIPFHPHLVIFLAQVARTDEGFESLPYMVEYVHKIGVKEGKEKDDDKNKKIIYQSNMNLIKLLSICAQRRSIELIVGDLSDDEELDDLYISVMPLLSPYRSIVNGLLETVVPDAYMDHFISSVLCPRFYARFWKRILHLIQCSLMGVDITDSTTMLISQKIANIVHQKLIDINEYLESDREFVYIGYERIMIERLMRSFFVINVDSDDDNDDDIALLLLQLPWSDWSYDEIKNSCINQIIDTINVGSTYLYNKKDDGTLKDSMSTLLKKVNVESIKKEIETQCLNLTGTEALFERRIFYVNIDTNYRLSPCDLLSYHMRHAKTPKERAKVTRLLNFFSFGEVDGKILYASIQSMMTGHTPRVRYSQRDAGRYTDIDYAMHSIDSEISLGPRHIYDHNTSTNSLTRVRSYRIITDHTSGHCNITMLIFREIYEWSMMSDDLSSDMDSMSTDGRVQCVIEHQMNGRTIKLRKIALSRMVAIDHMKLEAEKQLVINQALDLRLGSIIRCDIVTYQKDTWFIIVSGSSDDNRETTEVEDDPLARRVVSLMENYERLSKRVSSVLNILDDDNAMDIIPDPVPQAVIMYDETGDVYDDEKKEYISSRFALIRRLAYMSRLELETLYIGKLVVPCVQRQSLIPVMTRLVDVRPGLFSGTLSLQGIVTSDRTIFDVSVEKLIFDVSKYIDPRMTMREIRRLFGEEEM